MGSAAAASGELEEPAPPGSEQVLTDPDLVACILAWLPLPELHACARTCRRCAARAACPR